MPDHLITKVRFKKRDIAALHDMPSANADDRIVLRACGHRSRRRTLLVWFGGIMAGLVVLVGLGLAALEAGFADGVVRDQAQAALARAVGAENRAEMGSAGVRITLRGEIALEARDVVIAPLDSAKPPNRVDRVLIALDPMALLTGRIAVKSVNITGVGLVAPERQGFDLADLAGFRVDSTGTAIKELFVALNQIAARVEDVDARVFRFSDVRISGSGALITIEEASVQRIDGQHYEIEADLIRAGRSIAVHGMATSEGGGVGLSEINGEIDGIAIDLQTNGRVERRNGVSSEIVFTFKALRGGADSQPALDATVTTADGTIVLGGIETELSEARVNLAYMPAMDKIEITPSLIRIGETVMPFTGGLIDADRIESVGGVKGEGVAFDLVVKNGLAAPGDSDEPPISFDGKAFGHFDAAKRLLVAEELVLASARGGLFGSASWRFVTGLSPEMNLVAEAPSMTTAAVKQLWPYWVGKQARQWVLNNLYGGTVSNGRIQLTVPAGHFPRDRRATFNENQLQIDFDIQRARMNVAGDIPPLRDTIGHMKLRGSKVSVTVASATAFFPTGRKVDITDATFTIPATDQQPLMAELAMSVSGEADAVAELITYHPIDALDRIGLSPEDLSGTISSTVTARFGLNPKQSPPPPDWTVDLQMSGVDIAKPIEGRSLTKMDGSLYVTPTQAELKTDALVDGAPMKLDVVQPVGDSSVQGQRKLSGTLSPEAREKIAPGTNSLISGPVGFVMETGTDGRQLVTLDLKPAELTVPGIGWTKGEGVAGTLRFALHEKGGLTRLDDLRLSGDGFEATGALSIKGGQLASADFTKVVLSPRDNYRAKISRSGKGYKVALSGQSFDARPMIALAKSTAASSSDNTGAAQIEVSGSVDTVHGYSDEKLTSGVIAYKGKGSRIEKFDFKAVTQSGQAVVIAVSGGQSNETIKVTSGDAGAFVRFAGVYSRIRGGLLNVGLTRQGGPLRRGVIDIRNFVVVGEPRLSSLVSTPSKKDGKTLRDAVKADIDVSEARFEVANAKVVSGSGELLVSEGVVRGPQIGASFQGKVYDGKGLIDLTGTFMPAYGVNRLFGELPLIGALLGNGRDRGLIGITFRLTGKTASPLLEVNPLSVIAPGVFRSIFEFRR